MLIRWAAIGHGVALGYGPGRRSLQFSAYTFDICLQDIYTNLIFGGTTCVPSDDDRLNNLAGVINKLNVNHACLTATVACLLKPSTVPTLKAVTFVGEAVTREALEVLGDKVELHDAYGPAECTVFCTVKGSLKRGDDPANIGRGLASRTWVVDSNNHNRLVPIGCSGELLIEGPLLSRGCESQRI
jgi:non-ribosomal peptide synthetase component F